MSNAHELGLSREDIRVLRQLAQASERYPLDYERLELLCHAEYLRRQLAPK